MPPSQPPVIGISCMDLRAPDAAPRYAQNQSYVNAVREAGGAPVLLPLIADEGRLSALYARLDGLLLPGGGDVDPALFHERPRAELRSVSQARDEMEIRLARWAADPRAPKPLLAICRGIQVLNVALEGTLYQDLSLRRRATGSHDTQGQARTYLAHAVDVVPASRLHQVAGESSFRTNSMHHQAIKRRAPQLVISARAPDGVVEAVEVRDHPFAIGVQWHPEELAPAGGPAQRLFEAFVAACRA